jgi:hypothetical protein
MAANPELVAPQLGTYAPLAILEERPWRPNRPAGWC